MNADVSSFAALAITAFTLVALGLLFFMVLVQPIWCLIDCAVDRRRSGIGKAIWIVVLVVLYGFANWFYGAFAAAGAWLRRLTRLAWLFAILSLLAFFVMYSMHADFRRGIDQEWRRGRDLVVIVSPAATQAARLP